MTVMQKAPAVSDGKDSPAFKIKVHLAAMGKPVNEVSRIYGITAAQVAQYAREAQERIDRALQNLAKYMEASDTAKARPALRLVGKPTRRP